MKVGQPIGDAAWGPFCIRITLGMYFFLAGWTKFSHIKSFVEIVKGFKILPEEFATVYAILLPYVEVTVGLLLILGIWTTLSALLATACLASYIYAVGLFPHGSSDLFNKDIILLAGAISLLFTGAGAISIDKFRRDSGG